MKFKITLKEFYKIRDELEILEPAEMPDEIELEGELVECCGMCVYKGNVGDKTKGCADKDCVHYRKPKKIEELMIDYDIVSQVEDITCKINELIKAHNEIIT